MSARRFPRRSFLLVAALVVLTGCSSETEDRTPRVATPTGAGTGTPSSPAPGETASEPTSPSSGSSALPAGPTLPEPSREPQDVLTGLDAPWSVAFLPAPSPDVSPALLVTQRDEATVVLLTADGVSPLTGPGADQLAQGTWTEGEAGLLGVAVDAERSDPAAGTVRVLLYRTTTDGNELLAGDLDTSTATLGPLEPLLTGVPAGRTHDGGRIAVGPDQMVWVATGDAGVRDAAQDPASLAGKILRLTPDGEPAPDNPGGGAVWSSGHRNVQGLGWDAAGTLVASEFGQNTWDEVNVVEPGGNHGWPVVEGIAQREGFVDPAVVWSPSEASPSGLAVTEGGVVVAALRGQRLWWLPFTDPAAGAAGGFAEPEVLLSGVGRLRDVVLGPDGALWVLTNNTDGRGDPRDGDDRLLRVAVP